MSAELEVREFASMESFEEWLKKAHLSSPGVWVKFAKKGVVPPTVTYAEALDVALCYGWIDGQKKSLSETHWLQRFTRRSKRSMWSQVNREKVMVLEASGRMQAAGIREVERAKADGRWERAYAGQRSMESPQDLRVALKKAGVLEIFEALSRSERYSVMWSIHEAKRSSTRAGRIEKCVEMCRAKKQIDIEESLPGRDASFGKEG